MPETDSVPQDDPMAGAGTEDTATPRQRMFALSKELWNALHKMAHPKVQVPPASGYHWVRFRDEWMPAAYDKQQGQWFCTGSDYPSVPDEVGAPLETPARTSDELKACEQKALALSLYLKDEAQ